MDIRALTPTLIKYSSRLDLHLVTQPVGSTEKDHQAYVKNDPYATIPSKSWETVHTSTATPVLPALTIQQVRSRCHAHNYPILPSMCDIQRLPTQWT